MKDEIKKVKSNNTNQDVLRAVYALNMCTVSVSQIIDYNDKYILEQEYEAILNNLNLEKMPKADALKNILVELLNTITFFRIQEIKKEEIEKEYQKRMKNAIWSAVPNINMIVGGGPLAIAYSIASQVGIGYMNYRKERNKAQNEKDKKKLELEITAIEQFNALRRELFTTAWELAEEYEFDDRLRLTEKQIKQYNKILMDHNELRKYVRLDAIKDKFEAFPPFWYFFGHTACLIAEDESLNLKDWERENYRKEAKNHFNYYEKLNKFNILREDQITSAFALEYIDLLLLEEKPDNNKINSLIEVAEDMSGNSFDVKQLCAISYLKIGNTIKAANLLLQLVNEGYNTMTNAKLLSRIYVSQCLCKETKTARYEYDKLKLLIGEDKSDLLYPMPELNGNYDEKELQTEYLKNQKVDLYTDYREVIMYMVQKYRVEFNRIIPCPNECIEDENYYETTKEAQEKRKEDIKEVLKSNKGKLYIDKLVECDIESEMIDILNKAIETFDDLFIWKNSVEHDKAIGLVLIELGEKKEDIKDINNKLQKGTFSIEDYDNLQKEFNFKKLMKDFIEKLYEYIYITIEEMDSSNLIEDAEYNLIEFCNKYEIELVGSNNILINETSNIEPYIEYSIWDMDEISKKNKETRFSKMFSLVKSKSDDLVTGDNSKVSVIMSESEEFHEYFGDLKCDGCMNIQRSTLMIIKDNNKIKGDLLFTVEDIVLIRKYKILNKYILSRYNYNEIEKKKLVKEPKLVFGGIEEYINEFVEIDNVYSMIGELDKIRNSMK